MLENTAGVLVVDGSMEALEESSIYYHTYKNSYTEELVEKKRPY